MLTTAMVSVASADVRELNWIEVVEGTMAELGECTLEVEHTCEGPYGRVVMLVPDCGGDNKLGLGMGLVEGDCVMLGDGYYCVVRVDVGRGAIFERRYTAEAGVLRAIR